MEKNRKEIEKQNETFEEEIKKYDEERDKGDRETERSIKEIGFNFVLSNYYLSLLLLASPDLDLDFYSEFFANVLAKINEELLDYNIQYDYSLSPINLFNLIKRLNGMSLPSTLDAIIDKIGYLNEDECNEVIRKFQEQKPEKSFFESKFTVIGEEKMMLNEREYEKVLKALLRRKWEFRSLDMRKEVKQRNNKRLLILENLLKIHWYSIKFLCAKTHRKFLLVLAEQSDMLSKFCEKENIDLSTASTKYDLESLNKKIEDIAKQEQSEI